MDRREFLESSAAAAAVAWSRFHWSAFAEAGVFAEAAAQDAPYTVLTPAQVRLLDAITAQIIPTDETPGAREARVVRFIDRTLGTFAKDQKAPLFAALDEFVAFAAKQSPGKPFVEMTSANQIATMQEFEKAQPRQFNFLRRVTMVGMFSNPKHGGNFGKVGWQMIGFRDQYSWAPPFGYYDRV